MYGVYCLEDTVDHVLTLAMPQITFPGLFHKCSVDWKPTLSDNRVAGQQINYFC